MIEPTSTLAPVSSTTVGGPLSGGDLEYRSSMSRLALVLALALAPQTAFADDPVEVSIVRLLAAPQSFHDKWVRVIGFLDLAPEAPRLYLHREDQEHGLAANGIPLGDVRGLVVHKAQLDRRYVLVEGVFRPDRGGSITQIRRCMLWSGFEGPAKNPDHRPCA